MRLLDLFCGAGGASMGYFRAGFEVVGVDIRPQPRYPFTFVRADAMTYPLAGFNAVHASPPCQSYSKALRHLATPKPMLIDDVEQRLRESGLPWIIENVEGSPIPAASTMFGRHGAMVCGSTLGLPVYRHRLFLASFAITGTECDHRKPAMNPHNVFGRERIYAAFGRQDPERLWRAAMGVPWMNKHEGREAIPPAYTAFIGAQLRNHVEQAA
jgi:DNA (cytosine-5)-methyltransferase 1